MSDLNYTPVICISIYPDGKIINLVSGKEATTNELENIFNKLKRKIYPVKKELIFPKYSETD